MRYSFKVDFQDHPIGDEDSRQGLMTQTEMRAAAENCILNTIICRQRTSNYFQIPIFFSFAQLGHMYLLIRTKFSKRTTWLHPCQVQLPGTHFIPSQEFWGAPGVPFRGFGLWRFVGADTQEVQCTLLGWSLLGDPISSFHVLTRRCKEDTTHTPWQDTYFNLFFRKLWISINPTTFHSPAWSCWMPFTWAIWGMNLYDLVEHKWGSKTLS